MGVTMPLTRGLRQVTMGATINPVRVATVKEVPASLTSLHRGVTPLWVRAWDSRLTHKQGVTASQINLQMGVTASQTNPQMEASASLIRPKMGVTAKHSREVATMGSPISQQELTLLHTKAPVLRLHSSTDRLARIKAQIPMQPNCMVSLAQATLTISQHLGKTLA